MGRRTFIEGIAASAAAWPFATRAQQDRKLPMVGLLGANAAAWNPRIVAFAKRMSELGWIEGRTIAFEYRWDDGRPERAAEIAAEFVRLKIDVIVTVGSIATRVKQLTSNVPVVFAIANDPVGSGLVASLARPGGHVTGLSSEAPDLGGKRLEILRQVVPRLRRLGIVANPGYSAAVMEKREIQAAAGSLAIEAVPLEIRRAEDIGPALEAIKGQVDALYVVIDALVLANQASIIAFARAARLPTIFQQSDFVTAGGFMSYGPNIPDLFRRAAELVDKTLRGTKPGDIPVEQPTKFELVVNLKTAKALGLTIPESFLWLADEVIE